MTESSAKKIFLVRAVERIDTKGAILPFEARTGAGKSAGGTGLLESGSAERPDEDKLDRDEAEFLSKRAEKLEERLRQKGALARGVDSKVIPGWFGPLLITAVLVLGFFSANLGRDGAELNILALPLLGILAWNLAVYVLAVFGLARGVSGKRSGILTSMARKLGKMRRSPGPANGESKTALDDADEAQLAVEWFEEKLPVHSSGLGTVLHLAAAALAVGGVAGLFYQGWSVEYVAVWEDTLFNADSLARFFGFLFAPASWVTGIEIPLETLPEIQRGAGLHPEGGDALPWLQLYAATMGVFVVVPRAIFAVIYRWHTARLRSDFPLSVSLRPYLTGVLRDLKGESQVAEIIPYAYAPEPRVRDSVRGLLHDLWGGGIFPEFRAAVEYGDEDEFLEGEHPHDPKYTVLLMNFAATPEDETHGFLGKALRERVADASDGGSGRQSDGRALLILLDGSGFSKRFGTMPEFGRRVEERTAAWARVMDRSGLQVATINLTGDPDSGSVREVAAKIWSTLDVKQENVALGRGGDAD